MNINCKYNNILVLTSRPASIIKIKVVSSSAVTHISNINAILKLLQ